jgi:sorbitol/mannitol transport system permease protein
MSRAVTTRRKTINTVLAWSIGILIFFPILWTILTSFKTEAQAINDPPLFLFFDWTLENYAVVQERSDYMRFLWNSVIIAGGSTLIGVMIAIPAAWSMAFVPSRRTKDILLWMLSTKMLPAVGVLYPIYLIFIELGLLDTRIGLVVVIMLINLPIIVWMLYTYFKEIPGEILEAARMDGASLREEIIYVLTPMAVPGIASTMLLNFILAWNEAFLDAQPDRCAGRATDSVHCKLFEPGRPVLRQAQCGLDDGHCTDPDTGLVQPKATRPGPDLRRREIGNAHSMGRIVLDKVTKRFGSVEVIPPLDLTIEDGEFTVFVGPSGCGKSTLLRLIAGLEDLSSGKIEIDGSDVSQVPPAKRGLAMVFQSYALYPHMSVRKNIAFPLRMAKLDQAEIDRRVSECGAGSQSHRLSRPPARAIVGRSASACRHRSRHRA